MALFSGTKLGPYEIHSLLGAGGMGEVYRARDQRLRREVAIKVLPASLSADPERLRRFEQEAQATAALNHPNIVALYDTGIHEGAPYIVSELLEGETLRAKMQGRSLPLRKAIEYGVQIARALATAHQKGIVHRDLKPENIFITNDGQAKVLDFGLAKFSQEGLATQMAQGSEATLLPESAAGTLVGTVGYMSPEQVRGKPVDARSDVFAFGALMYEMLSGRRAFQGASPADTISSILTSDPPPLEATEQRITPVLDRILRHCLEKNPEERFQSARDIAFDLESLSTLSSATMSAISADPVSPWRRWRMPLLTTLLLTAAAAAGYYFAGRGIGRNRLFSDWLFAGARCVERASERTSSPSSMRRRGRGVRSRTRRSGAAWRHRVLAAGIAARRGFARRAGAPRMGRRTGADVGLSGPATVSRPARDDFGRDAT